MFNLFLAKQIQKYEPCEVAFAPALLLENAANQRYWSHHTLLTFNPALLPYHLRHRTSNSSAFILPNISQYSTIRAEHTFVDLYFRYRI